MFCAPVMGEQFRITSSWSEHTEKKSKSHSPKHQQKAKLGAKRVRSEWPILEEGEVARHPKGAEWRDGSKSLGRSEHSNEGGHQIEWTNADENQTGSRNTPEN